MRYTIKLQSNAVSSLLSIYMAQRNHTDKRARETESKFYLPAGVSPSFDGSYLQRLWAALFNHRV
jgi:hypothetical protein